MSCGVTLTTVASQVMLQCLKEAVWFWRPGLLTWGMLLLHINVRLHTTYTTTALLDTWHWGHVLLHPHTVLTWLLCPFLCWQPEKHNWCQQVSLDDIIKAEVQMWPWEQNIFCCQALEDLFICHGKCLNKFDDCGKKKDWCSYFLRALLVSTDLRSP